MKITTVPCRRDPNIRKAYCPKCGEKVHGMGFAEGARIEGLSCVCKRCGELFLISVEPIIRKSNT